MKIIKIYVPKYIIILLGLAVMLNIGRIFLFASDYYVYLLWNIVLAILPFIISSMLLLRAQKGKFNIAFFIIGGILWLLLIPNAPYIVTDLIHIHEQSRMPILYDSFLLFSSALVGLILGMYSLSQIDQIIRMKFKKFASSAIIAGIILFTSFGVYLGRFLRFNSWDIFNNPMTFINGVWNIFSQPNNIAQASVYTLLFFFFIYMSYGAWKNANIKI
ncbi:MAG TPA: DUF1361 domain-containing protein [Candidatus Paceibacterota bacterium]|nr:DUF1361 domain-containing protein [Candidatus Paceibacterota bacterium]